MENTTIQNKWPSSGTGAQDLLKMSYYILIDGEITNQNAFQAFYIDWIRNDVLSEKNMFVLNLRSEKSTVSANWQGIRLLQYAKYEDCIPEIKAKGGAWIYITQNAQKAETICEIFKMARVLVRVYQMDQEGKLQNYRRQYKEKKSTYRTLEGAFELTSNLCEVTSVAGISGSVPTKMDYVYDSQQRMIQLKNEFISNPQSITYETSLDGLQAKIYQKQWLQISYFKDKVQKMLEKPINVEGICWPKDFLYDEQKKFVGILVPKSEGYQLKQDLMSQTGIQTNFPNWDRKDLTHLVRVILEKIVYLQNRNVIFGLLNTSAIFVKDIDHVYFADMDSYQIEGYPILTHERVLQAPELQNEDTSLRLYTKQQDNYEIALLVFMLLMPGKFPYNKGNNADISKSIEKKMFAFRYGEGGKVEHGAREYFGLWRFVWSHLGNDLKKAFYFTFQNGQAYSLPEQRKYANFWLNKVKALEEELKNPYDRESLKIFPRTFKRYSGMKTIRCQKCQIDHPDFYYKYPEKQICNSCLGKPSETHFECKSCHKIYYYDYLTLFKYEKLAKTKGFSMPTHCPYCRSDRELCKGGCNKTVPLYRLNKYGKCPECAAKIVRRYQCRDCRKWIELTQSQVDFYREKSLNLPVRCEKCRRERNNGYRR